jgi:hypothetical protein
MLYPWRRDDNSCGADHTVTVTETILQGAETSTLVDLIGATSTGLIATATGRPSIGLNAAMESTFEPESTSTSDSSTQQATVSVTSTVATTKTLNLVSATSSSAPRASECPSRDASKSSSAPAATIAGSVVGSIAGLALIVLLVSYLLKRKRKLKLTIKRKTEEKDDREVAQQIENVLAERDQALEALERRRSIVSPKSFDFGFSPSVRTPLPKHSTAVAPPQCI